MADWVKIAEGTNIWNLASTIEDMEFPKGTKMKIVMNTPGFDWLFDIAGAELAFKAFTPDGWDIKDVHGESGQGIVDMEADPAWWLLTLAFIKAHWVAITIAGMALSLIVSLIIISVKVPAVAAIPITLIVGIAIGIIGLILLSRPRAPPRRFRGRQKEYLD